MNIDLKDRVIVITGSARGLGSSMAKRFAQEGAKVAINYRVNEAAALKLLEEINKDRTDNYCIAVKADVTKEADVIRLYHKVLETYGRVDVLINNAGKVVDNYVHFMNLNQWNDVISTNLTSAFICSRVFARNMISNTSGKIINISSLKGQVGSEGQSNYSASKAGMIGFTKALAKEIGPLGISVNAICPGFIVSDLNRNNPNKACIAKDMSVLREQHSLDDFLNFIIILCSTHIQGISGQVFNLDSRIG